ncbi:globin domain-containing protein [Beggiatoa leptomitoformis]|uniref:Hemin receptor n=1 Tax=Beggiatoa leptomitoformis TaxID=288004 RepID=A0A2N9YGW7_9GAMM|nr:globin domain-containing protein [Beggiatoa leptomitoformis]ALG68003.1 hemin receptor [Beggiatoa leptomitoformis]AUI69713.1 hemin receptor [Beggiatoa leptomitoformis]
MLNASCVRLVCQSWEKLSPTPTEGVALGKQFYTNLFKLDPSLQEMFRGSMTEQNLRFIHIMDTIVNAIDKVDALVAVVERLGVRHVGYGVQEEDYIVFGNALLTTIEQGLGDDCTPEIIDAWSVTYKTLADLMKKGAEAASSVV